MMKLDLQKFAEYTATMSNDSRYTIKLTVNDAGGYDAVNNTSAVNYILTATKSSGAGYYNEYARSPVIVNINGVDVVNTKVAFDFRGSTPKTIILASGTSGAIKHNDDGTKTINVSGTFTDGSSSGSRGTATASGTFTMVTIPRSSEIGVITFQDDLGGQFDISSYASGLYTCVEIYCNSVYIKTINGVSGGINSFTLTSTELNTLYNSLKNYTNFEDLTINNQTYKSTQSWENILVGYCKTYSDSTKQTQIGSTSTSWGGTVYLSTTNLYPTFNNFTYKCISDRVIELTGSNQTLITGYSNVEVEISSDNKAVGNKNADIVNYLFQDGTLIPYSTNKITHDYKYTGGSLSIVAKDSRGLSTSANITPARIISNYTAPVVSNVVGNRNNGIETTTYLQCDIKLWKGNFSDSNANEITLVEYQVKPDGGSWSEWYSITNEVKTAVSGQSVDNIHLQSGKVQIHANGTSNGFPVGIHYQISIRVGDGSGTVINFQEDMETGEVDSGIYLDTYMRANDGYKYAINGVVDPNLKNGLQVNGSLYLNGQEINSGGGGKSGDTLPIGSMIPYGKSQPPTNWLICNGQAVSRTTYADLFAVIGTSYGAGDGSTTFNLPDKRGKVSVGLNGSDTDFNTIGKTGGEKTHTLSVSELPSHSHSINCKQSAGNPMTGGEMAVAGGTGAWGTNPLDTNVNGGGQAHNNVQPYEVDCWIIKAFQSAGVVGNVTNSYSQSTSDTYSCNYINKSAITVRVNSTDVTIAKGDKIPFDSIWASVGDNFILTNGYIYSKKSCKIEISAQIWTYSASRSWLRLYVGSIGLADVIGKSGADAYTTFTMAPLITEITPSFGIAIIAVEALRLNAGAGNTMVTYITVKEVC